MTQLSRDKIGWQAPPAPSVVPPKRYRIGELARHTGLTRQTLHNYTRWGLIAEVEWTPGGHRLYDEAVFERLGMILRLRRDHTVEEMKKLFEGDRPAGEAHVDRSGGEAG